MASSKSASVKLTLNPSSFINGLKGIDKASEKTAKRMESLFDKALAKLEKDSQKAAQQIEKSFKSAKISINGKGLINQLDKTEMRGEQVAANIGKGFKRAFSASAGGVGDSTRKLDRAIKELERAQKRLAQVQGQASKGKERREAFELKTNRRNEVWALEDKKEKHSNRMSALGGAAGGAVAGLAVVAGAMAKVVDNDYFRNAANVQDKATQVSVAARGAGQAYVDPNQLSAEWFAITQDVKGVTADALADGVKEFVKITGDLATARGSIKDFAKVAVASGTSVENVAAAAAAISKQFKITDPKQIMDVLATLTYQGKSGSFELSDAASLMPKMAAAGAGLGGLTGVEGVKTLGGLSQISKDNYGSPEESVTAINRLITNFTTKSDKLKASGVNVYDKKGEKRNLRDLIFESVEKVGGNSQADKEKGLSDIFGDGFGSIQGLVKTYNKVFSETKGTDKDKVGAARAAIEAEFNKVANAAGGVADVEKDYQQAQRTMAAGWTASQEALAGAFGKNVTPKMNEFSNRLNLAPGLIDKFSKAAGIGADMLIGFAGVLESLGILDKEPDEVTAKEKVAVNLRKEQADYDAKVQGMQMTPEAIAAMQKSDPSGLEKKRQEVRDLMAKRDAAGMVATKYEKEVETYRESKKTTPSPTTPVADPAKPSPLSGNVKIDNTVNVKVTNPNDLKGNNSPAPGFVPRS